MKEPTSWHSYPSIYALGHAALHELMLEPVLVEEKIDGSQFSFGRFDGVLHARSKGQQIDVERPDKMFVRGVEQVATLNLIDGWTYRGEYLQKPKHNALAYDRIPNGHVILFDINDGHESYLSHEQKRDEAARIGLECVPVIFQGILDNAGPILEMLDRESVLGGQKIEGVVVKNYARFGPDKKALMGKYVTEAFKEVHKGAWRESNPEAGDILNNLTIKYRTPARFQKAVQHLRERGELENSPRDIGKLMQEVQDDILRECSDEIREYVFKWAWEKTRRTFAGGLPQWYKDQLLASQFEHQDAVADAVEAT